MSANGGSPETVSIEDREFTWTADADPTRKLGGYTNALEHNGDGSSRLITTRTGWALRGGAIQIDDDRGDQEYIESIIASKRFVTITVTYVSGAVYSGKGQITGDAEMSAQSASMPVDFEGTGKLKKQ